MNRDTLIRLSKDDLIDLLLAQEARIAALERRLSLNSGNSSKPPQSDGLKKPPRTRSLREPSGRKPGGQKGHKGETLRQVTDPDATVDHYPGTCPQCGSALTPDMATGYGARQVFDDLPINREIHVDEEKGILKE
jgi:transposase